MLEKADESALLVKQSDNDMICRIVLSAVTLREEAIAGYYYSVSTFNLAA